MGVSMETPEYLYRIDHLHIVPAQMRFISFEPLLSSLGNISLKDITWAIVGGESGPSARPIQKDWVVEIKDQCLASETAFFFKQWGGTNKKNPAGCSTEKHGVTCRQEWLHNNEFARN
jgi:protein gp37